MLTRYEHELERAVKYPAECSRCGKTINEGDSTMIAQTIDGIQMFCSSCTDIEVERIASKYREKQ